MLIFKFVFENDIMVYIFEKVSVVDIRMYKNLYMKIEIFVIFEQLFIQIDIDMWMIIFMFCYVLNECKEYNLCLFFFN